MISLVQSNKPILGVIYWPTEDRLYVAQKNDGAYELFSEHWKKLSVSNISNLENCHAVLSRHHLSESDKKLINKLNLSEFNQRGSSLKVIDICCGKAEIYLTTTTKIKQWDTCASYCLITESGGKIRVIDSEILLDEPLASLRVADVYDGGLLGIAAHPDFSNNGILYTSCLL